MRAPKKADVSDGYELHRRDIHLSNPTNVRQRLRHARGSIPVTPVPEGGMSSEIRISCLRIGHFQPRGQGHLVPAALRGRKAANGQVFSDDALTAAHRTLPMGSLIVVTNLTRDRPRRCESATEGRLFRQQILDLSRPRRNRSACIAGNGPVRIDVYRTPKPWR